MALHVAASGARPILQRRTSERAGTGERAGPAHPGPVARRLAVTLAGAALTACGGAAGDRSGDPGALTPIETPVALASPVTGGAGFPYLSRGNSGVWMSWLEPADSTHRLRIARLTGESWSEPATVAESSLFFVNWADFPSIIELSDGRLMAHWLQRSSAGKYSYDVLVKFSADGGATWGDAVRPHADGTPTEHGFVTLFEAGGGAAAMWLDGREHAVADGEMGAGQMTLRFARFDGEGRALPDELLDSRTCDCCQTDAAVTTSGPVVVYRDRSDTEVRDIAIVRWVDGQWTEPAHVHEDGWVIPGCPVNGPGVAARGDAVAVAWFTAANESPRVNAAFSTDGGASFGDPIRIDAGDPIGRVDVLMFEDGTALVIWLERGESATRVLARRVAADGRLSGETAIGESSAERASGFPRMTLDGDRVLFAWTVPGQPATIRVARTILD